MAPILAVQVATLMENLKYGRVKSSSTAQVKAVLVAVMGTVLPLVVQVQEDTEMAEIAAQATAITIAAAVAAEQLSGLLRAF